jgi:hypothetical protein
MTKYFCINNLGYYHDGVGLKSVFFGITLIIGNKSRYFVIDAPFEQGNLYKHYLKDKGYIKFEVPEVNTQITKRDVNNFLAENTLETLQQFIFKLEKESEK